MSLLTVVLLVAFGAIYFTTAERVFHRPVTNFQTFPVQIDLNLTSTSLLQQFVTNQRSDDANRTLADLAVTLTVTGLATLLIGYFISDFLARRAIKPVREAYEKQRQFIADASHELKTPLAVIDANLEAETTEAKPSKWLKNISTETNRMSQLINSLLDLARLDITDDIKQVDDVDVSKTVSDVYESVKQLASKRGLKLTKKLAKVTVRSDELKIRQILMVLLENAIKYTDDDGKIMVTAEDSGKQVVISVANTHAEKIDADKLFDRFYRADSSRTSDGHGLGLSIAQALAGSIDGTIDAKQADETVTFALHLSK